MYFLELPEITGIVHFLPQALPHLLGWNQEFQEPPRAVRNFWINQIFASSDKNLRVIYERNRKVLESFVKSLIFPGC